MRQQCEGDRRRTFSKTYVACQNLTSEWLWGLTLRNGTENSIHVHFHVGHQGAVEKRRNFWKQTAAAEDCRRCFQAQMLLSLWWNYVPSKTIVDRKYHEPKLHLTNEALKHQQWGSSLFLSYPVHRMSWYWITTKIQAHGPGSLLQDLVKSNQCMLKKSIFGVGLAMNACWTPRKMKEEMSRRHIRVKFRSALNSCALNSVCYSSWAAAGRVTNTRHLGQRSPVFTGCGLRLK